MNNSSGKFFAIFDFPGKMFQPLIIEGQNLFLYEGEVPSFWSRYVLKGQLEALPVLKGGFIFKGKKPL